MVKGMSPLHTYIARNIPGIWYTVSEAAVEIGRSTSTLVRWRKQGVGPQPRAIKHGSNTVHIYSEEQIEELIEFSKDMKPGPKPKVHHGEG